MGYKLYKKVQSGGWEADTTVSFQWSAHPLVSILLLQVDEGILEAVVVRLGAG
jgi:hypothetical protein